MTFLNKLILWGLIAAAIPVVIHLLNRKRHRTVKWAAMSFLLKATRESRGKKKLKHFLILTARTLAVVTVVLAVAQPLVGGFLGWGGSKLDTVVLVLDRSLSMESETGEDGISKREKAINQVKQTLKEMDNPNLVLIDSATGTVQTIEDLSALDVLATTAATDTQANIPALVDKAVKYTMTNNTGETEIWVASDLQKSNWQNEEAWSTVRSNLKKQKSKLRVLALTAKAEDNLAVAIKSTRRSGTKLIVDFEINRRDMTNDKNIEAVIMLNGKEYKIKEYEISGQTVSLQETIDLTGAAISGYGYISIGPDSNKNDNNAFFAYGENVLSHTVIVTEGGQSTEHFLKASALTGFTHQTAESIEAHQLKSNMLSKASMVIWQAPLPERNNAKLIQRFLNDGGSVVFLPTKDDSENSFLDVSWGAVDRSKPSEFFVITEWNKDDGPQRNYNNGVPLPLDSLRAIKRRSIKGDVTSLADWDDKSTAMGRLIEGRGTAYFISTLPNRLWSDLDNGSVMVPVFQKLLEKGNKRFGSSFVSKTGKNSILADEEELISIVDNAEVNKRYAVEQDSTKSTPLYLAGVKRVGERIVATNRPAEEDDWAQIKETELETILADTNFTLFENTGESGDSPTKRIWQWMLIAALLFLIIEAILCLSKKVVKKTAPIATPPAS